MKFLRIVPKGIIISKLIIIRNDTKKLKTSVNLVRDATLSYYKACIQSNK